MHYVPKNAVGRLLTPNVPVINSTATVAEVEAYVRRQVDTFASMHYVYIINDQHHLVGVLSYKKLLGCGGKTDLAISHASTAHLVTVRPSTLQDRVGQLALKHGIKAVPVISKEHIFLGAITSDGIFDILQRKHTSDVMRLAGVQHSADNEVHEAIVSASSFRHVRLRLPWLILGLCGGLLAAVVIGRFEETLADMLVLAAFIPAIVYVADAVGSQTQILFIRALSIDPQLLLGRYLLREGVVNIVLGGALAAIMYALSWLWLSAHVVSSILAASVFLTVLCAVMVGVVLPAILHRRGVDPAVASGPLATVIRDIMSLFIYLGVAATFIG